MQPVFDGHNDVLLRLWRRQNLGFDPVEDFRHMADGGHLDAETAKAGGMAGGLCAIYVPSDDLHLKAPDDRGHYVTPMAAPIARTPSLDTAIGMLSIATRLERAGLWRICRSINDIAAAFEDQVFAAVIHMEGCEAIGADLSALDVFHAAGLRSLGPVWSRHNIFGHGVPFAFPMTPDTGPGLTEAGRVLVSACDRLGILVDVSHMTERGFWEVAELSGRPLVASHSNPHALVPVARNLTDAQMQAIHRSGGLAGLNFAVTMLREDGREDAETPLADLVRHVDYMVQHLGIDGVAIGSDFDGALIPRAIGTAAGLQRLVDALDRSGYTSSDLDKICRLNWLRVLDASWRIFR